MIGRVLVLGGARSGKSRFAEDLAAHSGLSPVLIATAEAGDEEMAARIARHKAERPEGFLTREEPVALAEAIAEEARADRILVVDCLTLWLTNVMLGGHDVEAEVEQLCHTARMTGTPLILIANELGMGLVPETALGRAFRDAHGRMTQGLARAVDSACLVVAGLPLWLKGDPL